MEEKEELKKKKQKKFQIKELLKGFTLVELLAVIVILAIIMIIAIPSVLDTMTTAKRKTFGEYVTKVYNVAQKKYLSEQLNTAGQTYVKYNIKTDLDLNSTGAFEGYVVIVKNEDVEEVYIGMSDGEYYTVTQLGDDASTIVPYINYTQAGEPKFTGELRKFDGKTNSFVSGTWNGKTIEDYIQNDYSLPNTKENLIEIVDTSNPDANFLRELKDLYVKATAINANAANYPGITQTYKVEDEWQKVQVDATMVPVQLIYPESTNLGYVVFVTQKMEWPKETAENKIKEITVYNQVICYKNANYHTIIKAVSPNITSIMPINILVSIGENQLRYVKPTKLATLVESNTNMITDPYPNGIDSIDKIPGARELALKFGISNTFYMSNDNMNGLTDADYTLEALMNKYMMQIQQMMGLA